MYERKLCSCTVALLLCGLVTCASAQNAGASTPASISVGSNLQELNSSLSQSPLSGSIPSGNVDPNPVRLTLLDAIDRGLKYNLANMLSQQGNASARAARLRALSSYLPQASAGLTETEQQVNLAQFGLTLPGFPSIVGPFGVFDVRGYVSQKVLDFSAINNIRAARANEKASEFSYQNTRDLVVLTVGYQYLRALADAARVTSVRAQVNTADALFRQATDQHNAGVSPGIDVLRAQVELQAQQQRLVVAQNDLDKQLLTVARVIGLPNGQKFELTDAMPAPQTIETTVQQALTDALSHRADYKQAEAQVQAAESSKRAAEMQRMPTAGVSADYGTLGQSPVQNHGTFTVVGRVQVPIFTGGRIRADVQQADTDLQRARAQRDDLRGRIEYEVRSALLDVEAANQQLKVATSALDLSRQELTQSRDRFAAGVTNTVEVVQAQEAQATAEDNYISSLFAHNFSKLSLARSVGIAEDATKKFLGGK